jgi:hypothetical protein
MAQDLTIYAFTLVINGWIYCRLKLASPFLSGSFNFSFLPETSAAFS